MTPLDGRGDMPNGQKLAQFEELMAAVNRLNVDWDDLARNCGDPKCNGDCEYVGTVYRVLGLNGYGAFQ